MYIIDDIAYAGEKIPAIKVSGVRPMAGHKLWLRFDFSPLLKDPAFAPLEDSDTFAGVYIDYGVTVWKDGDIDISPKYLYDHAVPVESIA